MAAQSPLTLAPHHDDPAARRGKTYLLEAGVAMKPGLIRSPRSARRYQAPSGEMVLTCHICGSSDLRPAYDLGAFAVVSCGACGHGLTIHTAPPGDTQERFQGHRW